MEDTHVAIDDIQKEFPEVLLKGKHSYYGVYDGHGGIEVAELCKQLLHKHIITDPAFAQGDISTAIKNGFATTDKHVLEIAKKENWNCGTTVVLNIITPTHIYIGNAGDSEAVLAKKTGDGFEATLLSHKHKPTDQSEKERIKKAGGHVVFGRVMGSLAVARAIGDKDFKFPFNKADADFVSADPYVNNLELSLENEFLVVACDGLWDKLTYQNAVDFVSKCRSEGKAPQETSKLIVQDSFDRGSLDNITAIVVYLTSPPPPKEEKKKKIYQQR